MAKLTATKGPFLYECLGAFSCVIFEWSLMQHLRRKKQLCCPEVAYLTKLNSSGGESEFSLVDPMSASFRSANKREEKIRDE